MDLANRPISQAVESYKLFARVEGRSARTLQTYETACADFIGFMGDVPLKEVTEDNVRRWIAHKLDRGYAKTTINIRLRVLRSLFHFLFQEGHLPEHRLERVRQLRSSQQYPFYLGEQQVRALLQTARSRSNSWVGKRNWAMILTFLDGMLRLSELRDLDLDDVNLHSQSIHIRHGKGDKERMVFMGRRLTRAMRDWLQVRDEVPGEQRVFITQGQYSMDARNIQRIIERLAIKSGLEGIRCSPHTLRHTGATLFIRNGGDPFSLQRLLGHAHMETTLRYVHMAGAALREAHAKASPVDRLLSG